MNHPEQSAAEDSICIGCGFCCDGTLHGRTTVRPDDEKNVIAAGLEIDEQDQKRFFRQPCPHFSCGTCSVYSVRPQVCRRYRCSLLKSLEAGAIDQREARERIAKAKELVAAVKSLDPTAVTPSARTALAKRLREELGRTLGSDREVTASKLLATAALEHFLNRWFLAKEEAAELARPPS
jgi:hypothetical protein